MKCLVNIVVALLFIINRVAGVLDENMFGTKFEKYLSDLTWEETSALDEWITHLHRKEKCYTEYPDYRCYESARNDGHPCWALCVLSDNLMILREKGMVWWKVDDFESLKKYLPSFGRRELL